MADMTRVTSPGSDKRLLLISDSFGVVIARWFPEYYGSVWHFAASYVERLSDEERARFVDLAFRQYAPDDVIFLFHDGAFLSGVFDTMPAFLFSASPEVRTKKNRDFLSRG